MRPTVKAPVQSWDFTVGRVLLREMFFPQDLIAVRGGNLRHTLDVHCHPLAAHPQRLLFLLHRLEPFLRDAARVPIGPGPLHLRHAFILPAPARPAHPLRHHLHIDPVRRAVGIEVLRHPQLHQRAVVLHLHRLDEGFDLVLGQHQPDEDAGQGQNDQAEALHELVFAPGPLLGLTIPALNFLIRQRQALADVVRDPLPVGGHARAIAAVDCTHARLPWIICDTPCTVCAAASGTRARPMAPATTVEALSPRATRPHMVAALFGIHQDSPA